MKTPWNLSLKTSPDHTILMVAWKRYFIPSPIRLPLATSPQALDRLLSLIPVVVADIGESVVIGEPELRVALGQGQILNEPAAESFPEREIRLGPRRQGGSGLQWPEVQRARQASIASQTSLAQRQPGP